MSFANLSEPITPERSSQIQNVSLGTSFPRTALKHLAKLIVLVAAWWAFLAWPPLHTRTSRQKMLAKGKSLVNSQKLPAMLHATTFKMVRAAFPGMIKTNVRYGSWCEADLYLDLSCYVDRHIFLEDYEPGVAEVYAKLIQSKSVVWDIGSNIGFYTVMVGKILRGKGIVYSFEPIPRTFKRLKANVEVNGLTNIKLFNIALSDHKGTAQMYERDVPHVTGTPTLDPKWAQKGGLKRLVQVKTRALSDLLLSCEIARPDLIKIDSETAEPVILNDVRSLLRGRDAPDIILEVLPPTLEPLNQLLLKDCRYASYHITPRGVVRVSKLAMRRPYNDYLLTKSEPFQAFSKNEQKIGF